MRIIVPDAPLPRIIEENDDIPPAQSIPASSQTTPQIVTLPKSLPPLELQAGYQNQTSSVPSICTFPPEILSEVFLACISGEEYVRPSPSSGALLLGSVCHLWRTVVLREPRMWCALHLDDSFATKLFNDVEEDHNDDEEDGSDDSEEDGNGAASSYIAGAQLWISRARDCPLQIKIDITHTTYTPRDRKTAGIYKNVQAELQNFVITHLQRFSVIAMNCPYEFLNPIFQAFPANLAKLEKLDIEARIGSVYSHSPSVDLISAPRLTSLSILSDYIALTISASTMRNIQELVIGRSIPLTLVWKIFNMIPHLRSFTSIISQYGPDLEVNSRILTLPHLESLKFRVERDAGCLFDGLCLPALRRLAMEQVGNPGPPWPYLTSLLKRSAPTMKEFVYQGVLLTENDLIDCLELMPDLAHLRLASYTLSHNILNRLTPAHDDNSLLCPNLNSLYLYYCYFDRQDMIDFIVARWGESTDTRQRALNAKRLSNIHADSLRSSNIPLRDNESVMRCVNEGLILNEEMARHTQFV